MIVLRILGIVLLVVLGMLVLGVVFLLHASIRVQARGGSGQPFKIRVGLGPIHVTRTLGAKKRTAPRGKSAPAKKKREQPAEKNAPKPPAVQLSRLDMSDTIQLALQLMDDMAGTLTFDRLFVTLVLHTADAARTGILLGQLSALMGNVYPYFARCFVLKKHKITLDADFDAEHTVWSFDISCMTRLRRYPMVVWKRHRELWRLWKSIRTTKEEKEEWRRQHTPAPE